VSTVNTDTLETIKQDIRHIRRSGTYAETFGVVLLASAGIGPFLLKSRLGVLIWVSSLLFLGIYFLFTGRYLKGGFGQLTKVVLRTNRYVTLPLSIAIIPIYFHLNASKSYRVYTTFPDKVQALFNKPIKIRIGIVDVLVLTGLLSLVALSAIYNLHRIDAASSKAHQIAAPLAPRVDTATSYHFTIKFPGASSVVNLSETVSGQTVSYSVFASTPGKGQGDFRVYAYHYPDNAFKFATMPEVTLAAAVHKSLISAVQAAQGTLVNSTPADFAGRPSEDGEFTDKTFAGSRIGYIRVFYIENYQYNLMAIGSTKATFDNFANSFQFRGA